MRLLLSIVFILLSVAANAQADIVHIAGFAAPEHVRTDSLTAAGFPADTARVIDNTSTVDLIISSHTEDQTSAIKESLLTEQLESLNPGDTRQKRLIERQLNELKSVDSVRRARQRSQIDSLKRLAIGAPVILNRDTIYLIYTNLGSFTPRERAELNAEKILKTARMFSIKADSLFIVEGGATSDIMYRETILASVTDADALWMDAARQDLAERYARQITDAIGQYKKDIGILNILKIVGLCLLILAALVALLKGVGLLFKRVIDKKMISHKDKWFPGFRIRNLELMDSDRELQTALFISKIVRYLLYIVLLYLAIPLFFSVFPPTQRLAETLFGWILSPLASIWKGFVQYLPNLFKIAIIIIIIRYIVKFFSYISREISSGRLIIPGFYKDWAKATFNILRIFLYAFMVIMIFPLLPGADSGIFQGVSVFIGILFTLGSTSVIGNLMAGMVITYMRPFVVGDRIRIGEAVGDVIEKSPFVIRIKTIKNEVITVPNSTVLSSNVTNYTVSGASGESNDELIINTTITMGYDVPWRQVHQLLIEAALKTDLIEKKTQPFVFQTALNDFSASYQLNAYTKFPEKQAAIYSQLHQNIQDIFMGAGVEMISPPYYSIRDGNKSTIPPQSGENSSNSR